MSAGFLESVIRILLMFFRFLLVLFERSGPTAPLSPSPSWTDIVSAVAAGVTALGLGFVAFQAFIGLRQFRQEESYRRAEALNALLARWDDPAMLESRRAVGAYRSDPDKLRAGFEQAHKDNTEERYTLLRVPNFFEDLGAMVRLEALPLEIIAALLRGPILNAWKTWEPTISFLRGEYERHTTYAEFERLAAALAAEPRAQ